MHIAYFYFCKEQVRSSPSYKGSAEFNFFSTRPVYTAIPQYGANASRGVHIYSAAFAGTHCAYPQRDGPVELTSVAGYM